MRRQSRGHASVDEIALVAAVASGDRGAIEALYRCYFPRLTRFIVRVTRHPQHADEIVNDTMLVVWRKAHTYDGSSKVSTWIFAIAFRLALKMLRHLDEAVDFDREALEAGPETWPEAALMRQEQRGLLDTALSTLSVQQRAVIELTYYEGYAYREIAEVMGCPIDTVKTRMFHARRKLKVLLACRREDVI